MGAPAVPVDAGLLERFRRAGREITWRPIATAPSASGPKKRRPDPPGRPRIAHLNDEEARVEEDGRGRATTIRVESGPVGALVLLLEIDRRGTPAVLTTHEAGVLPEFPQGAIEARWGGRSPKGIRALPMPDLVGLARYALA